jgi:hypothetical protein
MMALMSQDKRISEAHAATYLNCAREFYETAERLFDPKGTVSRRIDFQYAQAMELAFKAFLRAHGIPIDKKSGTWGHGLTKLYEKCRGLGLTISANDRVDIGNIVNFLDHANEHEGLRYPNPDLEAVADVSWIRQVVRDLMEVVEREVDAYNQHNPADTRADKLVITFGKPQ